MALEDRTLDLPFSGAAINERMYQDKTLPTKLKRRSHSPPSQELSPYMAMQLRTPAWCTERALVRVVQAHRTYTNHTSTTIARCVEGASALVQGGSSTANLHEPHQHREQGV